MSDIGYGVDLCWHLAGVLSYVIGSFLPFFLPSFLPPFFPSFPVTVQLNTLRTDQLAFSDDATFKSTY